MALQLVAAKVGLMGFKFRRGNYSRFVGFGDAIAKKIVAGILLEMFDDIAEENEIIRRQFADKFRRITNVDRVIEVTVHRREIDGMAFDTVDFHAPTTRPIARRVVFGGKDVGVLPEKMSPFPKAHADIKNRGRLEVPKNTNDGGNCVRTTAGHIKASTRR